MPALRERFFDSIAPWRNTGSRPRPENGFAGKAGGLFKTSGLAGLEPRVRAVGQGLAPGALARIFHESRAGRQSLSRNVRLAFCFSQIITGPGFTAARP